MDPSAPGSADVCFAGRGLPEAAVAGVYHGVRDWFTKAASWPSTTQPPQHERQGNPPAPPRHPADIATQPTGTTNDEQGAVGIITKMWHGFWESIVGTAHAEELPGNVKILTQRMSDLNDTTG